MVWGLDRRTQSLNRLITKASSVTGAEQDDVLTVMERKTLEKLLSIMDNSSHLLPELVMEQRSSFSGWMLSVISSTDTLRRSLLPRAMRI